MFDVPYDKLIQLAMQMDPSEVLKQLDHGLPQGASLGGTPPPFAPGGQAMGNIMNPRAAEQNPVPMPQPPFAEGAWQAESGTMMPPLGLVEGEQAGIPTQSTAPLTDKQLALLAGMMPKVEPLRLPGFIGAGGGSHAVRLDPLVREEFLRKSRVPTLAQILGAR